MRFMTEPERAFARGLSDLVLADPFLSDLGQRTDPRSWGAVEEPTGGAAPDATKDLHLAHGCIQGT